MTASTTVLNPAKRIPPDPVPDLQHAVTACAELETLAGVKFNSPLSLYQSMLGFQAGQLKRWPYAAEQQVWHAAALAYFILTGRSV